MRITLVVFLFCCFSGFSQIPNCSLVRGDYLWMSQTEVSVRDYRLFLSKCSKKDSLKNLPNTNLWNNYPFGKPIKDYYFAHPAYLDYPVVNITKNQAISFCNWLTSVLNRANPSRTVLVRLPTEKEWESAARGNNPYAIFPWGTEGMRVESGKNQGKMQANFIRGKGDYMGIAGSLNDGAAITAPVRSYWPNDFGLYNMSGNVSEMVAEEGIVKGGSWNNRADWLRIDKKQYKVGASPEIGFRYVVELVTLPFDPSKRKPLSLTKRFFTHYFSALNDTLLMAKYEVTNTLFSLFQSEMQQEPLLYSESCRDSLWYGLFPYSEKWARNYSWHPQFSEHPVVNVSYWQAQQFCAWFEHQYELIFHEKVSIRLPTESEWVLGARGGLSNSPYPWGGPYVRNIKGDFLANHNPKMSESENVFGYDTLSLSNFFHSHFTDQHDFDGEAVLAPVDAYFPNGFGLFNVAGNAAEMILDSHYTKGGSWKSNSYYLQINSKESWNHKPNPFTGFRVVLIKKHTGN